MHPNGSTDGVLAAIAAVQEGVFSRQQVFYCGGSQSLIRRRLRSGVWLRLHAGVYALAGSPSTRLRDVWAASLAIGPEAVVSHELALSLRGVESVPPRPLTFTVRHGAHSRVDGASVHQIDDHRPHHLTTWRDLRMSTPARASVELAATLTARRLGEVLDEVVIHRRLTTFEHISAVLCDVARPGKPGLTKFTRVLAERLDGQPVPDSILEAEFFAAVAAGGLPAPSRHVPLPGRSLTSGLVDGMYDDARLILEVDGRRWHDRIRDRKRDYDRDMAAARSGYQTLRFVHEHIRKEPADMCATIADVRAVRLAQGFDAATSVRARQ